MLKTICFVVTMALLSCKTTTYFITRHAEKVTTTTTTDPPLTTEGEKQAQDLKTFLHEKKITAIYSTNFVRTKATSEPARQLFGLPLKIYNAAKTAELLDELKRLDSGNVLIVGHSNTVDDIVNGLTGRHQMNDLADDEYGDLFIVKKKGGNYTFERMKVLGVK